MKHFKRARCVAISCCLLVPLLFVVTATATYQDEDTITHRDAVYLLSDLRILNGKANGCFDPTAPVTRAEMAKILRVIRPSIPDDGILYPASPPKIHFSDIAGHWAETYMLACAEEGFISGRSNGQFEPNAPVTATEAAKMLLCILGYLPEAEGFHGAEWANAVNTKADAIQLFSGLTLDRHASLSRDAAAQLIANALNAKTVTYEYAITSVNGELCGMPQLCTEHTTLQEKYLSSP